MLSNKSYATARIMFFWICYNVFGSSAASTVFIIVFRIIFFFFFHIIIIKKKKIQVITARDYYLSIKSLVWIFEYFRVDKSRFFSKHFAKITNTGGVMVLLTVTTRFIYSPTGPHNTRAFYSDIFFFFSRKSCTPGPQAV